MATKKSTAAAAKKRSIARRFNDSLFGRRPRATADKSLDRRTAKRLERYRAELKAGKKGDKDLTALDITSRIHELLNHGDRLTDLRKLTKQRVVDYNEEVLVGVLKEMHPIYQFRPEAYRFAGVTNETLLKAGIIDKMPPKRGPRPGSKRKAAKKPAKKATKQAAKKPAKRGRPAKKRSAKR